MDLKTLLWKHGKWILLILGLVTMVALFLWIQGNAQLPNDSPSMPAQTTGATTAPTQPATTVPTQPPTTAPTVPTQPTEPEPPETTAPVVEELPEPTLLELNTLKKKDFKKVDGYITCTAREAWLGVDVSVWQEEIDWEAVAAAGVKFAMIRIGYRGWSRAGKLNMDPYAYANLEGAKAAGLKVGVYFYSQATSAKEAAEEARYVLELLNGMELDMPVVFDWEVPAASSARTRKVKAKTIHASAMAFCEEIRNAGYQPMVYFNQWQGSKKYNLQELRESGVELWLAMYTKAMTYTYEVQMWQYTSDGRVPGIEGRVDLDLYFPDE